MRGEYLCLSRKPTFLCGTTSACAENTQQLSITDRIKRNYLRVRGEYMRFLSHRGGLWELPPRARRILREWRVSQPPMGTTSACAENTASSGKSPLRMWNYLRVRGEYGWENLKTGAGVELPPRARRIPQAGKAVCSFSGTTSACAENTRANKKSRKVFPELPPRARRIQGRGLPASFSHGTTSACAENTNFKERLRSELGNYLRVRGEYMVC